MPTDRAIVLGGSIAGLLAAAALSPTFDEVIIVDRDVLLVDGAEARASRRGVPQGDQVHHLLSLGRDNIESLVPGVDDDLLANGSEHFDEAASFAQYLGGVWRVRSQSDLEITCFRRPVFEWVIRRRVLALPNVTAVKGTASSLVSTDDHSRVTGVSVRGGHVDELLGDLVVDATGRGSKAPNWIEDLGYDRPEEAHLNVYMGYATVAVELAPDALPFGLAGVTCGASKALPIGASIRPTDHGNHIVAAYGMMRNYPPGDVEGLSDFLAKLPTPIIGESFANASSIGAIHTYRMPGNQRRYWERLGRRPEGFVVIGDAVASFDPLYGQGMTMASAGAIAIRDTLAESGNVDGFAQRVQQAIAPLVDVAFDTAVAVDAGYEGAEFVNLDPPSNDSQALGGVLAAVQSENVDVMLASRSATLYLDPTKLQTDAVVSAVSDWQKHGRTVDPANADPAIIPAA
ncbi:MAG: hypothetical protein JWO98_2183 [Frankiales bacterium]|nr:hypothetical protein [Frankiales bacterium]